MLKHENILNLFLKEIFTFLKTDNHSGTTKEIEEVGTQDFSEVREFENYYQSKHCSLQGGSLRMQINSSQTQFKSILISNMNETTAFIGSHV